MYKFLLFIAAVFSFNILNAQVFNGTGGPITDPTGPGTVTTCFPLSVTGVGTLDGTYGLATVCLNITHTYDADLQITLTAPNGTVIMLSNENGGTGDNYNGTCFSMAASLDVSGANAPFSGTYIPDGDLGAANNGQSGTGTWNLCITDGFETETGTLNSWSLTFNNTPAPPAPVIPGCSGNPPAGDACQNATPVCNFDGYCGNTSSSYNVDVWPELSTAFCGSIENNSFITFVASATTASFNVFVTNSEDGNGIQMMFYDGGCGSGPVNVVTGNCYNEIYPDVVTPVTATGLTIGNTYYLMFDGFAGDVCDYSLAPLFGVNILAIDATATSICVGQTVDLTASGGNGTYNWAGPNLSATTGATVTVAPTVTSTYTVTSVDPTGSCPVTKTITINITTTAPAPGVTSPLTLCQGSTATALTATGTALSWFTTPTGGTGSATAPIPSTATAGSTTYYVTQTLICGESPRTPIVVNVVPLPAAPAVTTPVNYCQGSTSTALTATGTGLLWYTTASGGTGSATAPIPSTATAGNTIYYVSQTVSTCEGPRAAITVTVTTTPAAPVVASPLSYCQNSIAVALTATGTNLLWYTVPTGGTGNAVAPIPSTATVGSTTWYVSQATGTCRGPRAPIVVNIVLATPAPVVANVTYCQGTAASPLTATGTSLLWYTALTGGTGSATAPTPSTATVGTTSYYVTQTLSCGESTPRTPINVIVNSTPAAPAVTTPVRYCQGSTSIALTATGTSLLWYTAATGGTGSATAPVPSTTTVGNTIYYVSQTTGICEGPRAAITVTINSIPAAPAVTTPVNYCQNITATALTAPGTGLLWYTAATGGTGNATAPVPSTTTPGNVIYYVSQTVNNCESPRSAITVTTLPATPAPTVTSPVSFCQGSTATALTATGTGLLWYTVATGGTGSAAAPIPSTTTVGSTTYYVSQTTAPCGQSVRTALVVNITSTPAAPAVTSPVVHCQNTTATALTATGTALLWYTTATGGTGSATAPVPSTTTVGNTTYYVSQSTGVCEGPRAAIIVTINSIPAAPAVTSTITYCQTITATALTATGSNLLWYTAATGGTGNATAPTPSTTTPGNVIYYVSQTVNSCESPRSAITVTTLPSTPAPTVSSPVTYCQASAASALTATGSGLLWYTTATGGTGSATAPVPSTATGGSTTYYVSQTTAPCGESVRVPIVVNVTALPAAPSFMPNPGCDPLNPLCPLSYCQGSTSVPLTAIGTGLLWYTTATGGTGSATAPTPSTATVGNITYYVSQTINGCEGPRASITVTINAIPAAPAVTSTVTYCQTIAATALTATGSNLLWYTTATGGTGNATAPTPSTTTPGNVIYYVSQSVNSCESPRSAITVTTLPSTPAPTATSPVIFCQGSTATALTATGTSLLWYTTATGGTGSAAAPVPSTTTVGSTTYYVSQTTAPCGESVRRSVVVNINGIPAAPTTSPITICQAVPAAPLTATGSNLLWYTSATGGTGVPSLAPSSVSVGNTTYYVSQTVATCEGPRAPLVVTVVALPPAPVGSGPYTYCQGVPATQLTATGTSLLWYTTATGGTGNATAPTPSTVNAGTFTYYVTQSFTCGESPRTPVIVTVNPTPLAPVTNPVTYCQGTTTTAVTATGTNLLWYSNATGGIGSSTAPVPSSAAVNNTTYYCSSTLGVCEGPRASITVTVNITPGAPGVTPQYSYCQETVVAPLTATGTNILWYNTPSGGIGSTEAPADYTGIVGTTTYYVSQTIGVCEGPRAPITVTVNPYPNLGPNLRDTACFGDSVNLTSKFNTTGFTFKWTLYGHEVPTPEAIHESGVYQLEAINSFGCSDTVLVIVKIMPKVIPFAGNDTTAIKGMPHQLIASGGTSYLWSPANLLNNADVQYPLTTLDHDQQFVVTVTDAAGCSATDKVMIQVYDGPTYYVPNAFSPNGDGLNDIFRVVPVGIAYTDWFRIFNRFGQMVFETNQWMKGWDGTFRGAKQPVGNYVWVVKGRDKYGKVVEMKGTVLIVQ